MHTAVLLFGPTASGKTGLSLPLAQAFGGEVINADSRQVYRHMPIITAMPEPHEFAAAPHHLFDYLEPDDRLSVVDWGQQATAVAQAVWARGGIPFFVGGTGFYLRYLTHGLSPVPPTTAAQLAALNAEAAAGGLAPLRAELARVDPDLAARLAPNDTQRTLRGVAVWRATGRPLSDWQREPHQKPLAGRLLRVALCPPRDVLYKRIHDRFEGMLAKGLVAEAEALYAKGYARDLPALSSIGLPLYYDAFEGRLPLERAHDKVLQHMRNYAKRQTTWLRNSYAADTLLDSADAAEAQGWLQKYLPAKA
jgi:tRNA dimethylallyltransferase